MVATRHAFHGIQEKTNVFIPLEFRNPGDMRPRPMLANAYGAKPAKSQACHQVSTVAPLTECSLAINLLSAWLSHKGGATTRPNGLIQNVKVDPGSSNPPSPWNSWDEYLRDKLGKLTLDQITGVVAQNQ